MARAALVKPSLRIRIKRGNNRAFNMLLALAKVLKTTPQEQAYVHAQFSNFKIYNMWTL